jgi:hypothetical protein
MCVPAKQLYAGQHVCQSIGGIPLANTILNELFTVLAPAALAATAQAWPRPTSFTGATSPC